MHVFTETYETMTNLFFNKNIQQPNCLLLNLKRIVFCGGPLLKGRPDVERNDLARTEKSY